MQSATSEQNSSETDSECLCLKVRDTGILRCAGLALQDLGLWPWSTGLSKKRLQGCASDSRIRLNSFLVKFWRLVTSNSTVSLGIYSAFSVDLLWGIFYSCIRWINLIKDQLNTFPSVIISLIRITFPKMFILSFPLQLLIFLKDILFISTN